MQLGPFSKETPVFLAPMAGVTDLPMRQLAVRHGADVAVGEMMASDLSLSDSRKSMLRAQHSKEAGLRAIQLVGNNPATLAAAARYNVQLGAEVIDINMGCPAKKVCKKAAGSALLGDPELVKTLLTAVTEAVSVPVTLKIRTGVSPDQRNGVEIARIAESCGIAMLTVHGRTRADKFNGSAEYETLRDIVASVNIPVIANGDITTAEKAKYVLAYTGADGVMIGRAAQGRLWLPGAIARALRYGDDHAPTLEGATPSCEITSSKFRRSMVLSWGIKSRASTPVGFLKPSWAKRTYPLSEPLTVSTVLTLKTTFSIRRRTPSSM